MLLLFYTYVMKIKAGKIYAYHIFVYAYFSNMAVPALFFPFCQSIIKHSGHKSHYQRNKSYNKHTPEY